MRLIWGCGRLTRVFVLSVLIEILLGNSYLFAARLQLTWADRSTNEAGFIVQRKTNTNGIFSQLVTVGTDVTSYADAAVTPGTLYCYRVAAFNGAGTSSYSNESCAKPVLSQMTLAVSLIGKGPVTSSPAGILCPPDCTENFPQGTTVTLTAALTIKGTPPFWSGECTGKGSSCSLAMDATKNITISYLFPLSSGSSSAPPSGTSSGGNTSTPTWTLPGGSSSGSKPSSPNWTPRPGGSVGSKVNPRTGIKLWP